MRRDRDEPCLFLLARREMHLKPVAGHDGAQLFRPFDQRDRARERVLDAKLVGVFRLTQSVEVEMPDRACRVLVELYQCEGGARHLLRTPAEPSADEGPCEGGLAAAERAAKPDYIAGCHVGSELRRQPLGIREGLGAHGERLAQRGALALRGARRPIVSIGNDRA